jgi:hypothetical protein
MRMWMVDPDTMCRKHLLGEHVEIHMLSGSLARSRSIEGFLAKHLLEPSSMVQRHEALAAEMEHRGYAHSSPLRSVGNLERFVQFRVDRAESTRELAARCPACASRGASKELRFD